MRIIAGRHRGRRLIAPKARGATRPVLDRVKQAMFDRLWSLEALPEHHDRRAWGAFAVLDLFCGTGSLGLEALSRGADHVTFADRDRHACEALRRNIAQLGEEERTTVLHRPADLAVRSVAPTSEQAATVRLIFCDPPYALSRPASRAGSDSSADLPGEREDLARLVRACASVAASDAMLVLRTPKDVDPPSTDPWRVADQRIYGGMRLTYLERSAPATVPLNLQGVQRRLE